MKTKKSSASDIAERRKLIQQIILEYQQKGKKITRTEILKELAKNGFHIDISTLYRDRTEIHRENSFVKDIAESNYSAYIEEAWNSLEYIKEQAYENYQKKWTITKIIESSKGKSSEQRREKISDESESKHRFLKLMKEAVEAQISLLKGDVLNVSVAFLGRKLDQYKQELESKNQEIHTKQKEIEILKHEINKLKSNSNS